MKPRTLICASLMAASPPEFVEAARGAEDADLIEVRADALEGCTPDRVKELLGQVSQASEKDMILTVRPESEGGAFKGSEAVRKTILEAGLHDACYVDLELEMPGLQDMVEKARDAGAAVIVSHHDFQGTPDKEEMIALLRREHDAGADIGKLAVKANGMRDVLMLLEVTLTASQQRKVCTISMGEHGKLGRVAAPLFGSALTYGYVSRPTAPGQLSVKEIKQTLEILGV